MSRIVSDSLVGILHKSRVSAGISQRSLAKSMHHSVSTIQSWEYGTANPPFEDVVEWLDMCGVNPLRYYLEYLHPDPDSSESTKASVQYIRDAVVRYFKNIAPDSEIRRLAFCLFGGTGSSWNGQIDELCALNHLQIKERIDVAELIYSKYTVANSTGSIRQPDAVLPDIKNFRAAIDSCYKAVADGKNEYTV